MARNSYNPHGKYYLPEARQSELYYRCRQLPMWQEELQEMNGLQAVNYERIGSRSGTADPTSSLAIRRAMLEKRIRMITDTANEVDSFYARWIVEAVATGRPFYSIILRDDVPATPRQLYARKKKFFWILSRKLEEQEQRFS